MGGVIMNCPMSAERKNSADEYLKDFARWIISRAGLDPDSYGSSHAQVLYALYLYIKGHDHYDWHEFLAYNQLSEEYVRDLFPQGWEAMLFMASSIMGHESLECFPASQ